MMFDKIWNTINIKEISYLGEKLPLKKIDKNNTMRTKDNKTFINKNSCTQYCSTVWNKQKYSKPYIH